MLKSYIKENFTFEINDVIGDEMTEVKEAKERTLYQIRRVYSRGFFFNSNVGLNKVKRFALNRNLF